MAIEGEKGGFDFIVDENPDQHCVFGYFWAVWNDGRLIDENLCDSLEEGNREALSFIENISEKTFLDCNGNYLVLPASGLMITKGLNGLWFVKDQYSHIPNSHLTKTVHEGDFKSAWHYFLNNKSEGLK